MKMTRRKFIETATMASLGAIMLNWPKKAKAEREDSYDSLPPLREITTKKGLLFGAAVGTPNLKNDRLFSDAVSRECNLIVPEYEAKWRTLMPEHLGAWHFEALDALYEYADNHMMKLRAVPLIWHEALPDWVKEKLEQGDGQKLMEEYILPLVSRYRGKIFSWDVVNEAIRPQDGLENGLRKSPWLKALGPDYIERAFRLAHEADPDLQLVYNDFRMEILEENARDILALVRHLKDKDTPLHAVGIQAHLDLKQTYAPLAHFCKEINKMGLDIIITELDVYEPSIDFDNERRDQLIADKTKEFLDIVFSVTRPKQIVTWGLSDRYSWLTDIKSKERKLAHWRARGLPLDYNYCRKPMWNVLYETVQKL